MSTCTHLSVPYLLILSEFAVSLCHLRRDDYSGEVTGMHLQERERGATARTRSVLPARADSVCVSVSKKGGSHDSLRCRNVSLFMGYSLNVLSVDLLAARTKWLNITRSWRGWPEDRPLCSKLKATAVSFCLWCHSSSCLPWCVSVVAAVDRAGCHMAECVNRGGAFSGGGSEMMWVFWMCFIPGP